MNRLQSTREVPHIGDYNLLPRTAQCLPPNSLCPWNGGQQTNLGLRLHAALCAFQGCHCTRILGNKTQAQQYFLPQWTWVMCSWFTPMLSWKAYEPWAGARAGGAVKVSIQKSIFFKYSDLAIAWRSKNFHAFFFCKGIYMKLLTMLMCTFSNGSMQVFDCRKLKLDLGNIA